MEVMSFNDIVLSDSIRMALQDLGFEKPTPIQAESIPIALEGRDIIGQAQTGTGKTFAFGIPIVEQIDAELKQPQAIVICPTRELAMQITEEFKKLLKHRKGVHVVAVYGGDSIVGQIKNLKKGVQIVVGTPGRILDHLGRGTLQTGNIRMAVLDEADEMLNMGFLEDIESILSELPDERQTLLFSATMSEQILSITRRFQQKPHHIRIAKNETALLIKQFYYTMKPQHKMEALCRLSEFYEVKMALVFCNTRLKVNEVVEDLQRRGLTAEGLHGEMRQAVRSSVMNRFRTGAIMFLVATDVAARGIDVDGVDAVFNFDVPLDPEYYVHRIGRTGRAGRSGVSLTFVVGRDSNALRDIERYTKSSIERSRIPKNEEIQEIRQKNLVNKVLEEVARGDNSYYEGLLGEIVAEGADVTSIAAVLMRMHFGEPKNFGQEFEFGDDTQQRERGSYGSKQQAHSQGGNGGRYPATQANMVRVFIDLGKNQRVSKGDILGAFAGETSMPGKAFGSIDIFAKHSYIEVPENDVKKVIRAMSRSKIKGKRFSVRLDREHDLEY